MRFCWVKQKLFNDYNGDPARDENDVIELDTELC